MGDKNGLPVTITGELRLMARESSRELVAASGRTYVFRLELNE